MMRNRSNSFRIPAAVQRMAGSKPLTLVWENWVGGMTFSVDGQYYIKWNPQDNGIDLRQEIEKLVWAGGFIAVPAPRDSR